MSDLLAFLVANQLWVAGVLGTLATTGLIRLGWFASDKARVIAHGACVFLLITVIRFAGGSPSPDLLAALPDAIAAILTAFGIALPVAGAGALTFRIARTQPGSTE